MSELVAPFQWRVTEVKHPGVVWARFAQVMEPGTMKAWFGENWPPTELRPLETVFVVRDVNKRQLPFDPLDHPAAWLSLTVSQFDPEIIFMSRGVWPNEHGRGLGRFMRQWAEDFCRSHGIKLLCIWVSASNTEHLRNVKADTYWEMSGLDFEPLSFAFNHHIE